MSPDVLIPHPARWARPLVNVGLWRTGDRPAPQHHRRHRRSLVALVALVVVWVITFSTLVVRRHNRYGTFDFDTAIHDQAIWLMAHRGAGFLTVRGLPTLGHHMTFAYWFFAPLSWLGAGPNTWDVIQVISLAAGAVALYLIGRDRTDSGWNGFVFGLAWLAHPSVQFLAWETIHPEVLALPWLFFGYLFASRGTWRWYWICLVMALLWKEDIGLAVAMIGLVMVIWKQRERGARTLALGFIWFVLTAQVLMPALTGHGTHAGTFYGDFGKTASEVAVHAVTHPGETIDRLQTNDAPEYARKIAQPFGFTSLLSPVSLLIGFPQAAINLLSNTYFIYDTKYHYVALPLLASALAMAEGVGRIKARRLRNLLCLFIAVCAMYTTVIDGISPIGRQYDKGYWPLHPDRVAAKDAAVAIPGGSDCVAATYNLVPHLSRRACVYGFPNPWSSLNWGIKGENPGDPETIDWLVLDRRLVRPQDETLLDRLIDSGKWTVVFQQQDVVVMRRYRGAVKN